MFSIDTFITGLPLLARGTIETLILFALSLIGGALIALPVALARNSRAAPARWFGYGFIFVFRGAPLLVLLYLIYYGLPQFAFLRQSSLWFLLREPYVCAVLALSLNSAGYVAEILAGALRAVPRGEIEAGLVAGLGRVRLFRSIILPHAARIALRAYGNEIVFLIKGTSAASMVTIIDLMASANAVYFKTYDPFTPLISAGGIYLLLIFAMTKLIAVAERRLSPELRLQPKPRKLSGNPRLVLGGPQAGQE